MRKLAILLLFCAGNTFARQQVADSLKNLLLRAKKDINTVSLYYAYGQAIEDEQPDSALNYYRKGKELSEELDYKEGVAAFASNYIVVLNRRGQYREALAVTEEALELYKEIGDKKNLSTAYNNVGHQWRASGRILSYGQKIRRRSR